MSNNFPCEYMDRKKYPCPYEKKCPIEIGTETCFCKRRFDYWNEKEKVG